MVSHIHLSIQKEWLEILKEEYNCVFVALEYSDTLKIQKRHGNLFRHYRYDIYGEDSKGNRYAVEIGIISKRKKKKLIAYAKYNEDFTFIYQPYTEEQLKELWLLRNDMLTTPPQSTFSEFKRIVYRTCVKEPSLIIPSEIVTILKGKTLLYGSYIRICRDLKNPREWQNIAKLKERKKAIEDYFSFHGLESFLYV